MKSIKEIDCRVVRERNGEVSILLGYPMENLVDMFSDMLEEPKENVRSWLRRELVPMSIQDLERLATVVNKALEVATMVKVAQDYSITVQDADCDCVEVSEAVEIINQIDDECLIIPIEKPQAPKGKDLIAAIDLVGTPGDPVVIAMNAPPTEEVQPDDIREDEMQAHEDAGKEVD